MKNAVTDLSSKYEIVIEPNEYGGYYVRIPDFPGIFTGGETWEEALRHAREALEATVEAMRKQKIPLPEPKMKFSGQFNVECPGNCIASWSRWPRTKPYRSMRSSHTS